jgi:hypothetical protein
MLLAIPLVPKDTAISLMIFCPPAEDLLIQNEMKSHFTHSVPRGLPSRREPVVLWVAGRRRLEMYGEGNKWTWLCGDVRYHHKYHKTKFHILDIVSRSCHSFVIISKLNYRPTYITTCINRTLIG